MTNQVEEDKYTSEIHFLLSFLKFFRNWNFEMKTAIAPLHHLCSVEI